MNTIDITKHGISNDGAPISTALWALIDSAPDNTELLFPAGRYFLDRAIEVRGKNNLTIRGEGAVLITHFTPWNDPSENNNGFDFRECSNIEIQGFTCTTDNPSSCAGRVIAKDEAACTYDVKIDEQFPITGMEHFWGTDTCDEEGTPDYVIETYDRIVRETVLDENGNEREKIIGTRYTHLGSNVIRVQMPDGFDLSRPDDRPPRALQIRDLQQHIVHIRKLPHRSPQTYRNRTLHEHGSCHFTTLLRFHIRRLQHPQPGRRDIGI